MAKTSAKSDDPEGMSDESIGYLADAKRGKARRFVLITKGMNVVSLVVYKKGSLEGFKKQAKEAGRGTLVYGVVTGQGENIRFQLAQSDGFEREPIKALALKSFLQESADFNCKPSFEFVAAHGAVLDPDDPLVARFLALKPAAQNSVAQFPQSAQAIQTALSEIERILDADPSSDVAYDKIGALEKLLKSLATGGETPPPAPTDGPPPPPPPPPPPENELAKFQQRLATLVKQAAPLVNVIGASLKPLAESARTAAMKGDFNLANQKLIEIAGLIKNAQTSTADSSGGKDSPSTEAARLMDRLKGLLGQAKRVKDADLLGVIKQKAGEIQVLLRKPNLEEATQALDYIDDIIRIHGAPPEPLVKVFDMWRDARETVMGRVGKLQDALRNKPDPRFHEVADKGFNGVTQRLQVGLHVALMDYDRAATEDREKTRDKALKAVDDMMKFLAKDPMVRLIDGNPLKVSVNLQDDLTDVLTRISATLRN